MPERNQVLSVVSEWVDKAENDLKCAVYLLKLGKDCSTEVVSFHVQQCVEKYLKAFLTLKQIEFSKTHDISKLIALIPQNTTINLPIDEQRRLTQYAVAPRYPGWSEVSLTKARQSVALARRVRKEIRAKLPKEVLRRRKR